MTNAVAELDAHLPDLWRSLQREAQEIAQREPLLAPMLAHILLTPGSLHDALARRLARELASQEIQDGTCRELLLDVLLTDPAIIAATARDLMATLANDPACPSLAEAFLTYQGFHAVQTHRIANHLWEAGRREIAAWLSNRACVAFGPDIHPAATMGAGLLLDHGSGVVIGETAIVEDDVTILQNVTLGGTGKSRGDRHPKVRRGVLIGAGAKVIGNIEIGAFSKVGAGSVVLKDVPAGCTVVGVPAGIVRHSPAAETSEIARAASSHSGNRRATFADLRACNPPLRHALPGARSTSGPSKEPNGIPTRKSFST